MALVHHEVVKVDTEPYLDQKPGTSGLRKKVVVFQKQNYLQNFIQALFNALPESEYRGRTLLCSGDGRYWNREAIQIIAEIAAGNGVGRLWIGKNGWCSTPAGSCIIREREGGVCSGGILLTASHNPGGPTEDFGVKYNCSNGGPAPESVTDAIFKESKTIRSYQMVKLPKIDFSEVGIQKLTENFTIEIIDPVEDWVKMMKSIFDFNLLKKLVKKSENPEKSGKSDHDFKFIYDGMNGIAGPYAKRLFLEELEAPESSLMRCEPLEDFGGAHPDPNLTYAKELVEIMCVQSNEKIDDAPDFGAAGDGDNDRNMILGKGWFVTPSDSVAIIASYAADCIPYFKQNPIKGVARSMPTSMALANVAAKLGIPHYEVPTGWKFFGSLMDAGRCSICGEESFGTGSDHVREKDGLWAVLAWLSILAYRYFQTKETASPAKSPPTAQTKSPETKSPETKLAETKSAETKSDAEAKATEGKTTEGKTTEDKATEDKATEGKATEGKATEGKATEDKAAGTKTSEKDGKVSVKKINEEFWQKFGRNYYTRYDYENVETDGATEVIAQLMAQGQTSNLRRDENLSQLTREYLENNPIHKVDQFDYTDPVDGSVSKNQGLRVFFTDGSRFVIRLSGTGSSGATIRLYLERFVTDNLSLPTAEAMEDFVGVALDLAKIEKYTGRKHPTVIT